MALPPDLDIGQFDAALARSKNTTIAPQKIPARFAQKPDIVQIRAYRAAREVPDHPVGLIDFVPSDVMPIWILTGALILAAVGLITAYVIA